MAWWVYTVAAYKWTNGQSQLYFVGIYLPYEKGTFATERGTLMTLMEHWLHK